MRPTTEFKNKDLQKKVRLQNTITARQIIMHSLEQRQVRKLRYNESKLWA